jgi:hypothetical protein
MGQLGALMCSIDENLTAVNDFFQYDFQEDF